MLHIRSSIKGVFLLETNGIPTALTTDLGETIKNGSLCVDTINDDLYILKDGIWVLVSLGGTAGNNDISYIRQEPTKTTVGGLTAGTIPNFETVQDVFDTMFYPFQEPSVSIGGGNLYEKGLEIFGNYNYTVNLRDGIADTRSIELNSSEVFVPPSNNGSYSGSQGLTWQNATPSTYFRHTYTYRVTFTNTSTKSNSTNIEFAPPTYNGVLNELDINENNVKGLTKRIRKKGNDNNLSFSPTLQRYVYAYPTSYGDLSSIVDPNGFDVTASFKKQVLTFTLVDSTSEDYNIYYSDVDTTQVGFEIDFIFHSTI